MAYRRAFGVRLRAVREAAGISQEALANKIDMSRRYLSGLEVGAGNPTLDILALLAGALHVEPQDLLPALPKRRVTRWSANTRS